MRRHERTSPSDAADLLRQVLRDAAASGRRRRSADEHTTGVVTELLAREWVDWDDERVVLTETGRRALSLLLDER